MADNAEIQALLNAFKVLGGNNQGRINYYKIASLLSEKMGLSFSDISSLLESKNCCKGEDFDYLDFCISIMKTKALFDEVVAPNNEPQVNSRTFTRRKGSGQSTSSTPKRRFTERSDSKSFHAENLKGCFVSVDDTLCANRFVLELSENAPIEIIAQALNSEGCCTPVPVIEVLLFLENEEPNKKLVTFPSNINSEGYCSIKMNLKKGKYLLVPVTVNWKSNKNLNNVEEVLPLAEQNDSEQTILTKECQKALERVFSCIDINRNGMLDQEEFDLFMEYICGETAADEWSTVEDNFETMNGELLVDGFLSLYKIAVITDPQDVLDMLKKMGLNNALEQDNGLQFLLTVTAKGTMPSLKALPIANFDLLMDEVFRKIALEHGYRSKLRNMNDLLLYTHKLPQRATVVIQNLSHSTVKMRLDCSNSENCESHRQNLNYTVEVPSNSSTVGHHLLPKNLVEPFTVNCVETVMDS